MRSIVTNRGFIEAHLSGVKSGGGGGGCPVRCLLHGKTIFGEWKMGYGLTAYSARPSPHYFDLVRTLNMNIGYGWERSIGNNLIVYIVCCSFH